METTLLTIFTRTSLHVGAGSSVGAVDQPVVRERHTKFPVIPGTALKGVLADLWLEKNEKGEFVRSKEGKQLFGFDEKQTKENPGYAGSLLIGESKILAFPVRSAVGCFAYVTCPLALERFNRDTGYCIPVPQISDDEHVALPKGSILKIDNHDGVVFEEYPLDKETTDWPIESNNALKALSEDAPWKGDAANKIEDFGKRIAVVSDTLFQYFVENNCEVANHNVIDDGTGVVKNFFNQENVPSETMFYSVINAKDFIAKQPDDENLTAKDVIGKLSQKLEGAKCLLQIGADMTTGLGWCSVKLHWEEKNAAQA
jgi:CRISPR-associated protein Cmr4